MAVEISLSQEQLYILMELVEDRLREKADDVRLKDLELGRLGLAEDEPKRVEAFSQGILALFRSDLVSLYRTMFAKEPVEAPVEAPQRSLQGRP